MVIQKKRFLRALLGAVVLELLVALVYLVTQHRAPMYKIGIAIDAGSSRTSLFIYKWDRDKEKNTLVIQQTFSCNMQGQGISRYANDPLQAGASLRGCLDQALDVIPAVKSREVAAFLRVPAGMRLLREKMGSASDQIMAGIAKAMKEYLVDLKVAQSITWQEEGAYGQITINYLLDSSSKHSSKEDTWVPAEMANTSGAVNLLSWMPNSSVLPSNEVSKLTFNWYKDNVYTQRHLCYGQNEVLKRLAKTLIEESPSRTQVGHPCYPKDYRETIWLSSLHTTPHIMQNDFHAALADRRVTLEGNGHAEWCRAVIRKLLNFSTCGQSQESTLLGAYERAGSGHFFAFSEFYFDLRFLNVTKERSLLTVSKSIRNFCTRSWQDLSSSYPEENPWRLRSYCTNANYVLTLLEFNETSWNDIIIQRKAGNTDVAWSLGYALEIANTIPRELLHLVQRQNPSVRAAAVAFMVSTLGVGLVVVHTHWHM